MGRPPALTPQQQVEARQRRADGATLKELAESYNVGLATIEDNHKGKCVMRLLYGDNLVCGTATMKRLMVIADEIGFLDRPAVMGQASGGGQWGLIGAQTPIRQFSTDNAVVKWTVFDPAPELSRPEVYHSYVEADFQNPSFKATVLDGLMDDRFAEKLIQLDANYGDGKTGETVRKALIADPALRQTHLIPDIKGHNLFNITTAEGRLTTLTLMAIEASVRLTNTLLNSEHHGIAPVSDDKVFARLLSMRASATAYAGPTAKLAPFLGFNLVSAVMPDEALQKLELSDINAYRKASKDAYSAWSVEINRLSAKIDNMDFDAAHKEIPRIIASELIPKLIECKNEMMSVRDKMFGDLIKAVTKVHYQIPTLTIAYLTSNIMGTIASFLVSYAPAVAPVVVDYVSDRRASLRKNSMSYLLGLSELKR